MSQSTIKINAKTANDLLNLLYTPNTELGKRVGLRAPSQINVRGFWPNPHFSKNELESDPNATTMTVYERDGSDYTIKIADIEAICEFYNPSGL
jgi:hypothetical protein